MESNRLKTTEALLGIETKTTVFVYSRCRSCLKTTEALLGIETGKPLAERISNSCLKTTEALLGIETWKFMG